MLSIFSRNMPLLPYYEINPCPFCGGDASPNSNWRDTWVDCHICGAKGPVFPRKGLSKAVQAWNNRSYKKRLKGQIQLQLSAPIPPIGQNHEDI